MFFFFFFGLGLSVDIYAYMHGYIYEYSSVHVEVRRGECGRQKDLKSSYMAVRRWRFRFCWNPHFSDAWAQLSALHCSCNFFVVGRGERPGFFFFFFLNWFDY
jgi:hypothetical protein